MIPLIKNKIFEGQVWKILRISVIKTKFHLFKKGFSRVCIGIVRLVAEFLIMSYRCERIQLIKVFGWGRNYLVNRS